MDHFKNLYWICYCFWIASVFIFWPPDIWDVSSPTKDWTRDEVHNPCIGRQSQPLDYQGSPWTLVFEWRKMWRKIPISLMLAILSGEGAKMIHFFSVYFYNVSFISISIWWFRNLKKSIKMENIRKIFLKMKKGIFALSSTWWYGRE